MEIVEAQIIIKQVQSSELVIICRLMCVWGCVHACVCVCVLELAENEEQGFKSLYTKSVCFLLPVKQ